MKIKATNQWSLGIKEQQKNQLWVVSPWKDLCKQVNHDQEGKRREQRNQIWYHFVLSLGKHFLQCRSAADEFFQLLYVWKHLYFPFVFVMYFCLVQKTRLVVFSFRYFKDVIPLSFHLHYFWQEIWCQPCHCFSFAAYIFFLLAAPTIFSLSLFWATWL